MEPLRIGIVGAGAIGQYDAYEARKSKAVRIVAVSDINQKAARDLAKGLSAVFFPEYDDLLRSEDVDAVLLAVPHHLHREMTVAAANHGKHVLLEKPMANTLEEATDIVAACRANRVSFTVNYSLRYLPRIQTAKRLIDEGALGQITGIQVIVHGYRERGYWIGGRSNSPDDWRASREKAGAGVLFMNVCHVLDYVYFLTGLKATRVYSEYGTLGSPTEVEDVASLTCRFNNGGIGTVSASTITRGPGQVEERIWGTNGTLILDPGGLSFYSTRPIDGRRPGKMHRISKFPDTSYTAEWVERFVRAVRNGTEPEISLREGWENLALISAARLSLDKQTPLEVQRFG